MGLSGVLRRRENRRPRVLFIEFCMVFTFAMAHFQNKEKKMNFVVAIELELQRR